MPQDEAPASMSPSVMRRGFTGHEMLDDTDLVQMNGRIYDPSLGNFLSADPFIQDKYLGASLNRYSYVWNNPLSYTDPSGHFVEWLVVAAVAYGVGEAVPELKPFTNIIVAASLHIAGQGWVNGLNLSGNALIAAQATTAGVTGGLSSSVASNSFSSFGLGFAQGVATFGIGHKFGDVLSGGWLGEVGRALSHGTVGGLVSQAQGGNFSSGFLAAGFSSGAGTKSFQSFWANVVYSAIAGGIGAELGGGKFADGAQTGAFVYLFNHSMSSRTDAVEVTETVGKDGTIEVSITARIQFCGDSLSPEQLDDWVSGIESIWTTRAGKYVVTTDVVVVHGRCDNCIKINVVDGDGRSFMNGAVKSRRGTWYTDGGGDMAAHEIGHAFGLSDRYTEYRNDDGVTIGWQPHPGYHSNIMAGGTQVYQSDIEQILNLHITNRGM